MSCADPVALLTLSRRRSDAISAPYPRLAVGPLASSIPLIQVYRLSPCDDGNRQNERNSNNAEPSNAAFPILTIPHAALHVAKKLLSAKFG